MPNDSPLLADERFRRDYDNLLAAHMPGSFPAFSVCVLGRGRILLEDARGYIDPAARGMPVTSDCLFDLASVSKLILEAAFLALAEAGKVRLDDPLVAALPEFGDCNPRAIGSGQDPHTRAFLPVDPAFAGIRVDVRDVTFRHLLTHSSGLPAWRAVYLLAADEPPAPPKAGDHYAEWRWRRGLAAMLRFPFVGTIGDTVRYSDIGIMLLGEAVARIHGARLDRALRDLILDPLDLRSFRHNPAQNGVPLDRIAPAEMDDHWRWRRAWGEAHDENACGLGGIAGHAGLFATAADVARFGAAWLAGDRRMGIGAELRRSATMQQAQGQHRMGLGWMLKTAHDSPAGDLFHADSYGHTGFTGTSLWIDPARQLAAAILTNRVYHGRQADKIHRFRRALHDLIARATTEA